MYFMATTKPRITISLEEQDYAVLKRLYTLNGVPMSRTVSELVAMLTPVLGRMADNLEAVAKADEETRQKSQIEALCGREWRLQHRNEKL